MSNSSKAKPRVTDSAPHIVLLGDSIFDNSAYTRGEPDVVTHLRGLLLAGGKATLLAVDGSTTHSITGQVSRVPTDATHLVISVGGNDALGNEDLLGMPVRSTAEALGLFANRVATFERDYRSALEPVFERSLPVTVCTIYNSAFEEPHRAAIARIALMMFNDVILRVAFQYSASVIDLRLVCSERTDYANPIEPSGPGGLKIAEAIARATGLRPAGGQGIIFC